MKAWLRIGFLLALFAQGPLSAGEEPQYTYVLVHGSSGGGWDWRTMDEILTADGHTVYRPTLTGLGERVHLSSPEIDLTTHIDDVENHILFKNLKDIVIVGHSYGGVVITGVMDRVPARIKHAIFLDALVPADGMSVEDLRGDNPAWYRVEDGMMHFFWLDPEAPLPRDVPQSLNTYTEPVSFSNPLALELPATFIAFIGPDQTIDQRSAEPSWKHAEQRNWTIQTLASGHNAQRSHPQELARMLVAAPDESR
jgi:pimeloyl-ACP methyl ester carboxylesterase